MASRAIGAVAGGVAFRFPDVDAILITWHERQNRARPAELAAVRDQDGEPGARLEAMLRACARLSQEHRDSRLAALMHGGEAALLHKGLHEGPHMAHAQQHLTAWSAT